ncbi:hypothetical protein TcasGA2_TC012466 [Tribolium castaneum]|uniref:Uncharacterized protein n=1 Tax=Tribolium castaneum TaxID=7070 RepID=D6X2F8_TRICA|nr:PREDICTED: uncharacterized protein LOC655224 [Tribolium castaneum]XP_966832.1 PREDICTED: uncharacterized protein LOC655224 [Tribolium castaneum]EFA10266.1 hypothetical protein TcasGA2_TC012466 [Tribolium castaneum]|eukprot:XP_008195892.1 PREDICTED: uncharacterized protein LOC655224 [Tribolium castaneum]
MATINFLLVILVITSPSLQDLANNQIDDDVNPFAEAKAEILKEQNLQNIGGMINNLMQSDGAKQLGDILTNAASGENAGEILQGLGSVLGQSKGLDPSMLSMLFNMFQQGGTRSDDSFDMNALASLLGSFMGQSDGEKANIWTYIPMILQTANAFLGPEAEARARNHQDHANLVPPLLEKLHLLFDHFINSEMGRKMMNTVGAEKFVKVFADENGRMSYRRFVDMLENHSFRKHWIRMLTNRIASIISHFSDPKTQKKYLTTFQHFINSLIKSQGYPKAALFDPSRPTETITALANHFAKETLHMKISSKQYVKPFVEYVQELFRLAQKKGMLSVDSHQLSDKLADTINLEVIEPIARVNRAYRFAKKVPQCDRYVMCLVNQESQDEKPSLPGLRPILSKSASLILSWFLSSTTKTPYLSLYMAVMDNKDCKTWYQDACNDFHHEEIKVKRELVHSEL